MSLCYRRNRGSESNLKSRHEPDPLPLTERPNPRTAALDRLPTLALVRRLQREDATVARAVARCAADIATAIDRIAARYHNGGRLIYVGAGTSGRLGALDAAECPPTFGVAPARVRAVIAGGPAALRRSIEGAEDDRAAARRDLARLALTPNDSVVGIAAGGRTPYTCAALRFARRHHALTIALACVPDAPLAAAAELAITPITGPEALTGSTRLKAATAQKMVLNQLSTGLMIRTGHVLGNLMIQVQPSNAKLRARAARILAQTAGWHGPNAQARARRLLRACGGDLRQALARARQRP